MHGKSFQSASLLVINTILLRKDQTTIPTTKASLFFHLAVDDWMIFAWLTWENLMHYCALLRRVSCRHSQALQSNNCRLPAFVWRNVVFLCCWWIACTSKEKGHIWELKITCPWGHYECIMFIWDLHNATVIILNAFSWLHIASIAGNLMLKGHRLAAMLSSLQGKLSIFKNNFVKQNDRKILPEAAFRRNHHRRGRFVLRLSVSRRLFVYTYSGSEEINFNCKYQL